MSGGQPSSGLRLAANFLIQCRLVKPDPPAKRAPPAPGQGARHHVALGLTAQRGGILLRAVRGHQPLLRHRPDASPCRLPACPSRSSLIAVGGLASDHEVRVWRAQPRPARGKT